MKKKIAIPSSYFCAWSGGTDLIRYLLSNLVSGNNKDEFEIFIIIPSKNLISNLKKIFFPYLYFLKSFKKKQKIEFKKWPLMNGSKFLDTYFSNEKFNDKLNIIYADYKHEKKIIIKNNIDIVLPCVQKQPEGYNWIGYLFDFQHEYLPEFFSKEEIEIRRNTMRDILFSCNYVFTNSKKTKKDAEKFFGKFPATIVTIPYAPCIDEELFNENHDEVREKYKIKDMHFITCNQFWRHKNHDTILKAFSEYLNNNGQADLIFTGNTKDRKFPEHFEYLQSLIKKLNLTNKVKILGMISKTDQLSLIRGARALIQPTLFEGGPGGGSCRDAISLDTEIFASDIEINREINCGTVKYFNAKNSSELSKLMLDSEKLIPKKKELNQLVIEGNERRALSGKYLLKIISSAINKKNKCL